MTQLGVRLVFSWFFGRFLINLASGTKELLGKSPIAQRVSVSGRYQHSIPCEISFQLMVCWKDGMEIRMLKDMLKAVTH